MRTNHLNDLYCVEWGVKLYSLTQRRRDTLRRLKQRAESNEQQVDVSDDGILTTDGTVCFSVRAGFLNRQVFGSSGGDDNENVDMSRPDAAYRDGSV